MKLLSKRGCIFLFWEFCCMFPGCPQELFFFYLRYHQRWMRLLAGPTFLSTPGIYIIFDLYCYYYIFISILGIILLWVFFFFFGFSFLLSFLTYLVRKCRLWNRKLSLFEWEFFSLEAQKAISWRNVVQVSNLKHPNHHWPLVGLGPTRMSAQPKENVNVCGVFFLFPLATCAFGMSLRCLMLFVARVIDQGSKRECRRWPGETLSPEFAANIQEVCSASKSLTGLDACDWPDPKGKKSRQPGT